MKRRIIKWVFVILVSAIFFQVWTVLTLRNDENISEIEAWLSTQPEVVQSVGREIDVSLKNRTIIEATVEEPRSVRYTLLITGSEGKVRIVIDAYDDPDKFTIVSFESM